MMVELETFVEHLFEHIFIENNILFPLFENWRENGLGK